MSKMKKWIVGILLGILISGGLALSLCYLIIPERTKCAIDIFVGYLNTPYGLGCGITITGSALLFFFTKYLIKFGLDNSKYGKDKLRELESNIKEYQDKAYNYKEEALKLVEEQKACLSNFNERIDYLAKEFSKVCETSPNAKIKALAKEFTELYETKKNELLENLGEIKDNVAKYQEKLTVIDELKAKYDELLGKVEEYVKERETTIDYQAKEE